MLKKSIKDKEKRSFVITEKEKLKYLVFVPAIMLLLYAAGFIGALINPNTVTGMDFGFFPTMRRALTTKAGWTGMVIIFLVVGALFLYLKIQAKLNDTDERNVKHSPNGTYGTSWFMDEKELAETFKETDYAAETDGIILGTSLDSGKIVSIPVERGKNRNIAISGAQGSMKSVAFSRPMIIQAVARGASIFCTDPKSELTEDDYYYLKSEGYKVYIWNLIDMVNSDSWDILAESEGEKYMDVLCDVIIKNTLGGDNPDHFYDGIEKDLLKALCYYVYTVKPTGKRTLGEAYNMLITYSADELDRIFDDLRKTDPENPAIGPYMLFAKAPNSSGCDYRIMLGCNDTTTSNYFSELTGLSTIEVSTERKTLGTVRLTDYTPQYAESKGEGQRPVMFEDEVRRMDDTQLLLIVRGKKAIRLKKFGYYNHTEALKFRQVKTSEIIPPWRIYQGEDVLTGEKIESNEEFLLRVSKDDSRLIVVNSEKYGSQRALLERDLAEIKKRRKKRGVLDSSENEVRAEASQAEEQKQTETNPDLIDFNMQSIIPGCDPQKTPMQCEAHTDRQEEIEPMVSDADRKEPEIPVDPPKPERTEPAVTDPVVDGKKPDAEAEPAKNSKTISIPAVEPERAFATKAAPKEDTVPERKTETAAVKVRERKSNLSQLKKRDELKADDYLNLLSKNNRK